MNREKQFLLDMLLSAKTAMEYLQEKSFEDLENNLQLQDALIRRLLIVGEAANRISEPTQKSLTSIPWRLIRGMRNRLVHEYDDLDLSTVWETVKTSLPILADELEKVVSPDSNLDS